VIGAALLPRILVVGGIAVLLWGAWRWHEYAKEETFEAGRKAGAAPFIAEGERQKAANAATSAARAQLDSRGEFRYLEAMQAKEKADADRKAADVRRGAVVVQLRDDLAAARRAAAERPADTGGADGARLARCEQLLDEGAGVVADLAGSLAAGGDLGSEGAVLLDEYRARRQRGLDWAEAATLNAPPASAPSGGGMR
jgi:hypothetical protein